MSCDAIVSSTDYAELKEAKYSSSSLFVLSAGWVALWMPAEYFLYDGWPFQQDIRIYNQIADANLVIRERAGELPVHLVDSEVVGGQRLE